MPATPDPSLDGEWQLIRAEMDGEPAHELLTANTVLELHAGAYAVRYAREVTDQGTFELGGTTEVGTLTFQGSQGPNAGQIIHCIYQRVSDRLRICYGLNGVVPTKFATSTGQQRYLALYRRRYSQ